MKINLIKDIVCTQRTTSDKYEQEFKNALYLCGTAHVAEEAELRGDYSSTQLAHAFTMKNLFHHCGA